MKKIYFILYVLIGFAISGHSQNKGVSEQKIRVKKVTPPFKKNILSASIGFGKYGADMFSNTFSVGSGTHTFKYTRRFSPGFGLTLYRTGSRTAQFLNFTIKTKHTGLAFRFTSSAERAFQFYFAPGIGIGKYPEYSNSYYDSFGIYQTNGPLSFWSNFRSLDISAETGFEYHFNRPFLIYIGSQVFMNADANIHYAFSAGLGWKF
jgi:hypothetical protein